MNRPTMYPMSPPANMPMMATNTMTVRALATFMADSSLWGGKSL